MSSRRPTTLAAPPVCVGLSFDLGGLLKALPPQRQAATGVSTEQKLEAIKTIMGKDDSVADMRLRILATMLKDTHRDIQKVQAYDQRTTQEAEWRKLLEEVRALFNKLFKRGDPSFPHGVYRFLFQNDMEADIFDDREVKAEESVEEEDDDDGEEEEDDDGSYHGEVQEEGYSSGEEDDALQDAEQRALEQKISDIQEQITEYLTRLPEKFRRNKLTALTVQDMYDELAVAKDKLAKHDQAQIQRKRCRDCDPGDDGGGKRP